ncbi:bifunctional hydroxymethylpyrimidine kinase/phosphomethylpyrimidine kinase [Phragmitibacter flavus]|nr:bifunctional hydroxymethylpyrimidine kinase/phosphomethylpyrimidine kinase [Phragmitibacter flavus]
MNRLSPPVVLTMAGSDCSAGAGIQADLKTFTTLGCFGLTALTSVVAETSTLVERVQLLDAAMVEDQVRVLMEGFPLAAAKTGMLGGRSQIAAVVKVWSTLGRGIPLVVDPVMVATSGASLLEADAVDEMTGKLFPLATVLTPNLDEAAALVGRRIESRDEMVLGAEVLVERYGCAVLMKGGHLQGSQVPDLLLEKKQGRLIWFEGERIEGVNTHGTGCTYSAAIAAGLGHGKSLEEAVREGKAFVTQAIAEHFRWGQVQALNHTIRDR